MKKIISFSLVLTLACCVFVSCGKKEEKNDVSTSEYVTADKVISQYYKDAETQANGLITTMSPDEINQDSKGIVIEMMSATAHAGELCMVTAVGTPDSEFDFHIYHDYGTEFVIDGLDKAKSDENGTVRFSFIIPEGTVSGTKAFVIRESGTDNYVRSAITVI